MDSRDSGATIFVNFTNVNSYNGTDTLNVNSTGAINVTSVVILQMQDSI